MFPLAAGLFILLAVWDAGYFYVGRHRGEYVEKPEWRFPFFGSYYYVITPINASETVTVSWVPATKDEDHGRFGEFGDCVFDRADPLPLRGPVSDRDFGGERFPTGILDTVE